MKKLVILALSVLLILAGCQSKKDVEIPFDSRFLEFVNGFTSGVISKTDKISVELVPEIALPDPLPEDLLDVSPSVEGSLVKAGQTLIFSPEKPLESGTQYIVELALDQLTEVPDDMETFRFAVKTIEQDFDIQLEELRTSDYARPEFVELNGLLSTADYEEKEVIEKLVKADGKEIKWQHPTPTQHRFTIQNIKRKEESYNITIAADGSALNIDKSEQQSVEIPSVKEFRILSARVNLTGESYVSVFFSDPIQRNQDLSGLIALAGEEDPRFVINGNEVQMYLSRLQSGTQMLTVYEGIKNSFGYAFGQKTTRRVSFDPENPQIKLIGEGTILPSTDGMVIPFEAVNLKTVRVDVIKIRSTNIPQFLQVNKLSGNSQIVRVGKKVLSTEVDLTTKGTDLSIWNRYTLSLNALMKAEKGALYRLHFYFKPEDSMFPCATAFEPKEGENTTDSWSIYENDGFNAYGNFRMSYPNGYRWSERDDPCKTSYYNPNRFVQKNLMASDLGLIAKIGGDNSMKVFTTNMVTAEPMQATVELLDFQLESLGKTQTDESGVATFNPERRPFVAIATSNGQKSFLKLDDGSSLSMSNFDVGGERIRAGIKGFIYGERGVWRPGDDIFLSFMLEDEGDKIPEDHPVVLEFKDPMGNLYDRQVKTEGTDGLYAFRLSTENEDITGNWSASIAVGNSVFDKTIKIETIKPNRLKINLDLKKETLTFEDRYINSDLNINWLTGLEGSNLKAETSLYLSQVKTTFDGYSQYQFDDLTKRYSSDQGVIFSGNTDASGKTTFSYQLPQTNKAAGMLKATFSTKAFEPGGDFSINTKSVKYLPYPKFVGMKMPEGDERGWLQTDQSHKIDVVVLNGKGQPTGSNNLRLSVYKLNWRWWWDQSEDYSLNYISSGSRSSVYSQTFSASSGKGSVSFQIDKPNWGRYIAVVKDLTSGHSTSQTFYIDWPGWAGDGREGFGASYLQVNTEQEEYKVAEEIEVSIPGSSKGRALISVENGSQVVDHFWIPTEKGKTTFTFKATPEMAPNVYLHVTLLQPHAQTTNDLPIRLYGIVPIQVYDPGTQLEPKISMADELAPGKQVKIKVTENDGKPMAYTLAVVDEGLLDITNFDTPDPWNHFFKREAIGVKTWDIFDDVIGAYGGRLERLLAIGGGGEAFEDEDKKSDDRFKPVVRYMGPFYLTAGSSRTHTFEMPQYIGSVKTMVVAGSKGAYGKADKATRVVQPLMVLGTLPRVTGPGEKIKLPVNLFKYDPSISKANVSVKATGVLKLSGATKKSVNLSGSNTTAYFDLEVDRSLGAGKVIITAKSGKHSATYEVDLMSRSPNTARTRTVTTSIAPGQNYTGTVDIFGMPGTNDAILEVAKVPQINLGKRLEYLIRYPHGCIEQTTSSVFPQLYLTEVMDLSNTEKVKIEQNINAGIKRLSKFQTHGGGMAYWPGRSDPNDWGSSYAYHFLTEAAKKGYSVPNQMMRKLKSYQKSRSKNWSRRSTNYSDDLLQAYRLFTLALDGHADKSAMNRMVNSKNLSAQSRWKLAAAYALIGRKSLARDLLQKAGTTPDSRGNYASSYGSSTRDLAILLETYQYLGDETNAFKTFKKVAAELSKERWMSTQTTAYCLLASGKFLAERKNSGDVNATINYAGKSSDWKSSLPIIRESLNTSANAKNIKITNKGKGTLYVTLTTRGTPFPGTEQASSSGLNVDVQYRDRNGARMDVSELKQGTTFEATVRVANEMPAQTIRDVALTHIFPSGWEIENTRLNDTGTSMADFNYQDIRDDRIYTYFHLRRGEVKTFKVQVTATYAGAYYMPGVAAEAMYDASTSGNTEGKWITVVELGG